MKHVHIPFPILQQNYDELYQRGKAVLEKYNLCKIRREADGSVSCFSSRKGNHGPGLCCSGCRHLGDQGCTVESLACKLWLCYDLQQTRLGKKVQQELDAIKLEGWKKNITFTIRASKQENLNGLEQGRDIYQMWD